MKLILFPLSLRALLRLFRRLLLPLLRMRRQARTTSQPTDAVPAPAPENRLNQIARLTGYAGPPLSRADAFREVVRARTRPVIIVDDAEVRDPRNGSEHVTDQLAQDRLDNARAMLAELVAYPDEALANAAAIAHEQARAVGSPSPIPSNIPLTSSTRARRRPTLPDDTAVARFIVDANGHITDCSPPEHDPTARCRALIRVAEHAASHLTRWEPVHRARVRALRPPIVVVRNGGAK